MLLGAVWAAAIAVLWRIGVLEAGDLAIPAVLLVGVALTWKLTRPPAPLVAPAGRLGAQLGFLAVYTVVLTATWMHHHHMLDAPLFARFDRALRQVATIIGNPNLAINPLSLVVIPGLVLWLLGARRRDVGLVRGRHTLPIVALWCSIPLAFVAVNIALGTLTLADAGWRALSNTLQNGPMEEIYWRGFLQSRLQRFGAAWALVGTSLAFGLAHLGLQLTIAHGDPLRAAAGCIADQAMIGVALGAMFQRTQSVIASSAFHVLLNMCLQVGRLLAAGT